MIKELSFRFLSICKQNYFEKITPANSSFYDHQNYQELIKIAGSFFKENYYNEFAGFLEEGQYFVALWAAHLLLEHGTPNNTVKIKALNTIVHYLDNPVFPEVSKEEKVWLNKIELVIKNK